MLSAAEQQSLVKAAQQGDTAATERLLRENRGLVYRFSLSVWQRSDAHERMELDDLLQLARLGFVQGVHHYDPERGAFSTCCCYWIRAALSKALRRRAGEPEFVGSLEEPAGEDGDLRAVDLIADDVDVEGHAVSSDTARRALALLASLEPELRAVVECRYGIGREPLGVMATALALHISASSVSHRERKALERLRELLERAETRMPARNPRKAPLAPQTSQRSPFLPSGYGARTSAEAR